MNNESIVFALEMVKNDRKRLLYKNRRMSHAITEAVSCFIFLIISIGMFIEKGDSMILLILAVVFLALFVLGIAGFIWIIVSFGHYRKKVSLLLAQIDKTMEWYKMGSDINLTSIDRKLLVEVIRLISSKQPCYSHLMEINRLWR